MTVSETLAKVAGLEEMAAIYDPAHFLLNEGIENPGGPNIGRFGENLTISFLSMGRVHLSERLCNSIEEHIPDFAGEVLVIDNGSTEQDLTALREILAKKKFRWRMVELKKNHGVAGGRNRTVEYVETDWLMCLDNDIYFIDNPIERLQQELGVTGAHFISMPLMDPDRQRIFALGGHLYLNSGRDGSMWLGAGSAFSQTSSGLQDQKVFLGTFLFGGSSILKVSTFKHIGGYDEAMFIGFEDLDFSIRIFRHGMKVACSGLTALVHDHPPAQSNSDADYERTRFSRQIIAASAKHLQDKYGFSVWSDVVEEWLKSQTAKMTADFGGHDAGVNAAAQSTEIRERKRIALVVDSETWAYANISRQISRSLIDYDIEIIAHTRFDNYFQMLAVLDSYDYVHIFWREVLLALDTPYNESYAGQLGCKLDEFLHRFFKQRPVTTSVYDHFFLSPNDVARRVQIFNMVTGYTVSSKKLQNIYDQISDYPKPSIVFPDGVDLELFKPSNIERLHDIADRSIVIGWVGNSKWSPELGDVKGINTLLRPAIDQLQQEGIDIKEHFADRQVRMIAHEDMPKYYDEIDLYICTSMTEGTPNPILEAMASGVPVISTDVGLVTELFGPKQKEFILRNRSVDTLKAAIMRFVNNRHLFRELSEENLDYIQAWDWKLVAPRFGDFIDKMFEAHKQRYG